MERLARHVGFVPWVELTQQQKDAVRNCCNNNYPALTMDLTQYWWKESSPGDNNWIAFNIEPAIVTT
jgi:hypothetical protein